MSRPRRTVRIETLTQQVNAMNLASPDDAQEGRQALNHLIERVLMGADAYRGFRYTDPPAHYGDQTRRHYHASP